MNSRLCLAAQRTLNTKKVSLPMLTAYPHHLLFLFMFLLAAIPKYIASLDQ